MSELNSLLKAFAEAIDPYLNKAEVDTEGFVTLEGLSDAMSEAIYADDDIVMTVVREQDYVDVHSISDSINEELSGMDFIEEGDFTENLIDNIESDEDVQGEIRQIVTTQIGEVVEGVVKELVEAQLEKHWIAPLVQAEINKHELVFQDGFGDLVMENDNIDNWVRRIVEEVVEDNVLATVNSAVRASNRNLAAIYQQLANEVGSME